MEPSEVTFAALLRGVNVGGRKLVSMADLRALVAAMGCAGARTLLQSGNVIFDSRGRSAAALERALEAETLSRLGLETSCFVRTAGELSAILAGNPFADEAMRDPARLAVVLLKASRGAGDQRALEAAIRGRERCHVAGRHVYVVYPDGFGRTKLTNVVIEKMLGTRATTRNWNTIRKLEAAMSAPERGHG